jgi:uncharacterized protein (TIGR03435 family)
MNLNISSLRGLSLIFALLWVNGATSFAVIAQEPTPSVSFEVVSVKPSSPDCQLVMIGPSPDGFHLHCLSLLQLVQYADGLNLFEEGHVLGVPAWGSTEHFDLDAPVQEADRARFAALPPLEKARLVQTALAERFALRTHEEQRDMPVYALVQGKPPLKLKTPDPSAAEKPTLRRVGRNRIDAYHCTMQQLLSFISPLRGRPIVDRTELSGKYDFSLDFTPETGSEPAPENDAAPSIFTAVQEQLGLRLVPDKAPQRVVVIDVANRPAAN